MFAYRVRGSHLNFIAVFYAKNNIRGGMGIMFTLAVLFVGLGIAAAFITPLEAMYKMVREEQERKAPPGAAVPELDKKEVIERITQEIGEPLAKWAAGVDADQARFLARERPALVSAILMILLFSLPFLTCLGSFNQLAGDIQYRGLRYLLLRTERANLFLGRFIGTAIFSMIVFGVLLAVVFLYLVLKADFYPAGGIALWLLHGYIALVLFSLPYIALCSWISAAMDSPFVALVICQLVTIFPIIFVAIATGIHGNLHYLGYIMPWPFKYQLLHPNVLYVLLAGLAMLAYTAVFLLLGLRRFEKRDL